MNCLSPARTHVRPAFNRADVSAPGRRRPKPARTRGFQSDWKLGDRAAADRRRGGVLSSAFSEEQVLAKIRSQAYHHAVSQDATEDFACRLSPSLAPRACASSKRRRSDWPASAGVSWRRVRVGRAASESRGSENSPQAFEKARLRTGHGASFTKPRSRTCGKIARVAPGRSQGSDISGARTFARGPAAAAAGSRKPSSGASPRRSCRRPDSRVRRPPARRARAASP